jgi:hypothetical protein
MLLHDTRNLNIDADDALFFFFTLEYKFGFRS